MTWCDDTDVVITDTQMDYFEELIKFRKDNEELYQEWLYRLKKVRL